MNRKSIFFLLFLKDYPLENGRTQLTITTEFRKARSGFSTWGEKMQNPLLSKNTRMGIIKACTKISARSSDLGMVFVSPSGSHYLKCVPRLSYRTYRSSAILRSKIEGKRDIDSLHSRPWSPITPSEILPGVS